MKSLSFLLLIMLCGCIGHNRAENDKLTLQGETLLRNRGISAHSVEQTKSSRLALDNRLLPYVRPNGRLEITPQGGECETLLTVITLGIFPGGCFNYVTVTDSGALSSKVTYQENMIGWILIPLVVLPGFSFGTAVTPTQYTDGVITAVNKIAGAP